MKCFYCNKTTTQSTSFGRFYSFCDNCKEKLYRIGGYGLVFKAIATNKEKDIKKIKKTIDN